MFSLLNITLNLFTVYGIPVSTVPKVIVNLKIKVFLLFFFLVWYKNVSNNMVYHISNIYSRYSIMEILFFY